MTSRVLDVHRKKDQMASSLNSQMGVKSDRGGNTCTKSQSSFVNMANTPTLPYREDGINLT